MTIRLFDQDPQLRTFTAEVLSCEEKGGQYLVTLDRTAFFPEGGGQGADHGTLGGVHVLDAHEHGGGITHLTDGSLTVGDTHFHNLYMHCTYIHIPHNGTNVHHGQRHHIVWHRPTTAINL